ncbi:hypothetical protein Cgig2_014865 [Carnegiea gigantea]|uniref:Uncharacterized protein n=1 Tax=Carnegiea gigantea TaxID=171969 RepID=A0A9Q1QSP5_9CARY|nr:hypothetical protein Cgig2_014865 [Carnegiea gigantea]
MTPYLLLIQFELDDKKVGKLYKDQKMARECYYLSLKSLGRKEEPPYRKKAATEATVVLFASREEHGHSRPEPTFEVVHIPLELEDPEWTIQIGKDLNPMIREGISKLLQRYRDMFMFDPFEMSGIVPNIMEHKLCVDSNHKLSKVEQTREERSKEERGSQDFVSSASASSRHELPQNHPAVGPLERTQTKMDEWRMRHLLRSELSLDEPPFSSKHGCCKDQMSTEEAGSSSGSSTTLVGGMPTLAECHESKLAMDTFHGYDTCLPEEEDSRDRELLELSSRKSDWTEGSPVMESLREDFEDA